MDNTVKEELEDCFQMASELQMLLQSLEDSVENSRPLMQAGGALDSVMDLIDEVMETK